MIKIGDCTYQLEKGCYILGRAALVGKKEKDGTYKDYFDEFVSDDKMGKDTFERGEREMLLKVNKMAIKNSGIEVSEIDCYLGGDLMNQIITSNYVAEKLQIPFLGIYSACATITSTMGLGSLLIDSGMNNVVIFLFP